MSLLPLLSFFILHSAWAGYQSCPQAWAEKNSQTYASLKKMSGVQQVGDCQVELQICDASLPKSQDSLVGDVLISQGGHEYYVQLYASQASDKSSTGLSSTLGGVSYLFKDTNQDLYAGSRSQDGLALLLNQQQSGIDEIDLSKKDDQNHSSFLFMRFPRWLTCQTPERLAEIQRYHEVYGH